LNEPAIVQLTILDEVQVALRDLTTFYMLLFLIVLWMRISSFITLVTERRATDHVQDFLEALMYSHMDIPEGLFCIVLSCGLLVVHDLLNVHDSFVVHDSLVVLAAIA